ncbi:MAG: hypothetical protein ACI8RD_005184 [Bacillariaceae sp.]|jgi:hypothetical protein
MHPFITSRENENLKNQSPAYYSSTVCHTIIPTVLQYDTLVNFGERHAYKGVSRTQPSGARQKLNYYAGRSA